MSDYFVLMVETKTIDITRTNILSSVTHFHTKENADKYVSKIKKHYVLENKDLAISLDQQLNHELINKLVETPEGLSRLYYLVNHPKSNSLITSYPHNIMVEAIKYQDEIPQAVKYQNDQQLKPIPETPSEDSIDAILINKCSYLTIKSDY